MARHRKAGSYLIVYTRYGPMFIESITYMHPRVAYQRNPRTGQVTQNIAMTGKPTNSKNGNYCILGNYCICYSHSKQAAKKYTSIQNLQRDMYLLSQLGVATTVYDSANPL